MLFVTCVINEKGIGGIFEAVVTVDEECVGLVDEDCDDDDALMLLMMSSTFERHN